LRQAIDEKYDFSKIDGFAISKTDALLTFDFSEADELYGVLDVRMSEKNNFCEQPLKDMVFVITGSIKQFKNRAELQKFIEEKGGKVVGSVSKNVNYLINNDSKSTTSKNIAAKKLGIKIINEQEFFDLTI
jgi:DNA ligase (NAD+)